MVGEEHNSNNRQRVGKVLGSVASNKFFQKIIVHTEGRGTPHEEEVALGLALPKSVPGIFVQKLGDIFGNGMKYLFMDKNELIESYGLENYAHSLSIDGIEPHFVHFSRERVGYDEEYETLMASNQDNKNRLDKEIKALSLFSHSSSNLMNSVQIPLKPSEYRFVVALTNYFQQINPLESELNKCRDTRNASLFSSFFHISYGLKEFRINQKLRNLAWKSFLKLGVIASEVMADYLMDSVRKNQDSQVFHVSITGARHVPQMISYMKKQEDYANLSIDVYFTDPRGRQILHVMSKLGNSLEVKILN